MSRAAYWFLRPLSATRYSFRTNGWCRVAIDTRAAAAGITEGPVFRSVNRGGASRDTALSEKVVWQLILLYAEAAGVAGVAPHDCRRTCPKLCGRREGSWSKSRCCWGHA
jgi:hypothetical protein